LAIDAQYQNNQWNVFSNGGSHKTEKELFSWAKEGVGHGAGEILFTSMNHDGTTKGFANEALCKLSVGLSVPVIASGGAGQINHFADTFTHGAADAALAASVFHYGDIQIDELKKYLREQGIAVRL
jgi:cyclase